MKIGILTHYNVNNQGAQLQMLAMKCYLEEMGHRVCILTYEKNFDFDKAEAKKNSMSLRNFPYYIKNYLFDKGIDKILKKVGEECTEIVIAAKNPDPEEMKYEISDFLYHLMVLMAERGMTWEDITRELMERK